MKAGILGSGDVAKALALGFRKHGHRVMVGSRTPSKLADWKAENPGIMTGSFEETAIYGEILVLAVKGSVAADALRMAGSNNLSDKIIIDATNPIADVAPVHGVISFFTDLDESLMEQLQKSFPEARFVKAFNSVGHALMVEPDFEDGHPTMFVCGNDHDAKDTVCDIVEKFGWEAEDMGMVEAARAIEPLCMLWCIPGFLDEEWHHAFKLLR